MQTKKNIHRTASFYKKKRFENIKLVSFATFYRRSCIKPEKLSSHVCVATVSAILLLDLELFLRRGGYFCLLRDSINIVLRDVKHSPKMFENTKG
jgi:hypothetical protein